MSDASVEVSAFGGIRDDAAITAKSFEFRRVDLRPIRQDFLGVGAKKWRGRDRDRKRSANIWVSAGHVTGSARCGSNRSSNPSAATNDE